MPEVSCPKNSFQNSGQKILQMTSEFWWKILLYYHFDQTLRKLWFCVEKQKMIAEFWSQSSWGFQKKLGFQWDVWAKHFIFTVTMTLIRFTLSLSTCYGLPNIFFLILLLFHWFSYSKRKALFSVPCCVILCNQSD